MIPKVLKTDDDDQVYLRDGVTAAFFLPMPLDAVAESIRTVFDRYVATSLGKSLKWASVGADSEEWRRVAAKTFDRCRSMLTKEAARKRKLTAFELFDGDTDGDAPSAGFVVLGNPRDRKEPLETNLVQMYFPSESVSTPAKADAFVSWLRDTAALMPFVYGYGSPGLHWAESSQIEALTDARAVAKRYPGFDVQNNEATRSDIDTMTRGARWLTFLGPDLLRKLGGPKAARAVKDPEITIEQVGEGTLIRAGRMPEIGDRNRREDTPLLRAVARALKPVTLFDEPGLRETVFAMDDPAFFASWEKRFLDGSD
jgi:hypothetical protein